MAQELRTIAGRMGLDPCGRWVAWAIRRMSKGRRRGGGCVCGAAAALAGSVDVRAEKIGGRGRGVAHEEDEVWGFCDALTTSYTYM